VVLISLGAAELESEYLDIRSGNEHAFCERVAISKGDYQSREASDISSCVDSALSDNSEPIRDP
jgi:hypothetical protein